MKGGIYTDQKCIVCGAKLRDTGKDVSCLMHPKAKADRYWDANVDRKISFDSPWAIGEVDADDKANDMHEAVVAEITEGLESGKVY